MKRTILLTSLLLPASPFAAPAADESPATERRKPNVVLIVSDDQGVGDLGSGGNEILRTPQLDRLRDESVHLNDFLVSPLCAPSRASIMTGRHSFRGGVWDTWQGRASLAASERTLGDMFSAAGYATGYFGKWHLGSNAPMRPMDRGFRTAVEWADSKRLDARMTFNGEARTTEGFFDDVFFDEALGFMSAHAEEPFFVVIASYMPHDHWGEGPQVPEKWVEPYRDVPGLPSGDAEVYGMIANLDHNTGRVLDWLRERGLAEDTIVIFLPDNGPVLDSPDLVSRPERLALEKHGMGNRFNAGLRGAKTTVFDGGIRVPCFIRWPGHLPAGREVDIATAHIDLLPTLAALCGIPRPDGPPVDGADLSAVLGGAEPPEDLRDRTLVIQQDRSVTPRKWEGAAVRSGEWKLVDGRQLYRLTDDPGEAKDVAADHPEVVARLRAAYEQWWDDVTAGDPFRMPSTDLGSPVEKEAVFGILSRPPEGWPVTVRRDGDYDITVAGLQLPLLGKDARVVLTAGGREFTAEVPAGADVVAFAGLPLTAGESVLDVRVEPPPAAAKMYYGNDDLGWRSITVRRASDEP